MALPPPLFRRDVPPPPVRGRSAAGGTLRLHAIRKTNATTLWEDSPAAAQASMGHRTANVTIRHYVQSAGILRVAVDGLRQPEAFSQTKGA